MIRVLQKMYYLSFGPHSHLLIQAQWYHPQQQRPTPLQRLYNASSSPPFLIQPNSDRSQRPVHEASICVQNVLVELTQCRVEVRAIPELHRVSVDLVRTRLGPEATESVVITGSGGWVKSDRWTSNIRATTDGLHGGNSLCSNVLNVGVVGGGDVLFVHSVPCYTALAVVSGVEEVHG